jgi:hypothetical protein
VPFGGGIPSFNGVGDGAEVSNGVGAGVAFFVVPPSAAAAAVALALALAAQRNGRKETGTAKQDFDHLVKH